MRSPLRLKISGQQSRRKILTSHVFGSTSTVKVEPQTKPPARSAKLFSRTTLTGAVEPYNGRGERAGINPMRMHFHGKYFFIFHLQIRALLDDVSEP
jgi:hypothetical protein